MSRITNKIQNRSLKKELGFLILSMSIHFTLHYIIPCIHTTFGLLGFSDNLEMKFQFLNRVFSFLFGYVLSIAVFEVLFSRTI